MKKFLQRLGKSLMLPVAVLPAAAILMGIGYWIDPSGWGANNVAAAFLIKAGGSIIDNMAILFAIGVAVGMSDDQNGTAALAGIVSWLMITTLLSPGTVEMFTGGTADPAFGKIQNQFIGILTGVIGATCYNKFKETTLPDALAFFSGKRSVAIVAACVSAVAALILFFVWPAVFSGLVWLGTSIQKTGAIGAGIYGFLNRLLIPTGLHHALNSVFWFDVAGIADLTSFWDGSGTLGVTGQYMTGFFPIMMFGLPGAALAMYHTAKDSNKKAVFGLLLSAGVSSFIVGITEPLEFAFMFLSPLLYGIHAVLTGISVGVLTLLPIRAGFNFSAGLIDLVLSAKTPMALNPFMLIPIGLVVGVIYYFVFKVMILKFDLNTPGREENDDYAAADIVLSQGGSSKTAMGKAKAEGYSDLAAGILAGLGGKSNIESVDNCITRLRLEVIDDSVVDENAIKKLGVAGIMRPNKNNVQVIIGTQVQQVADAFKKEVNK